MSGFRRLFFVGFMTACLSACGTIKTGTITPNDPAPTNGTLIGQGQLFAQNGQTGITGSVEVYELVSGGWIVRLDGVSLPSENAMQIYATIAGTSTYIANVNNTTGTTNYSFSGSGFGTWSNVTIHSTLKNLDYAKATFQ